MILMLSVECWLVLVGGGWWWQKRRGGAHFFTGRTCGLWVDGNAKELTGRGCRFIVFSLLHPLPPNSLQK